MKKKINKKYTYRITIIVTLCIVLMLLLFIWSLMTGQYPLSLNRIISGEKMQVMVFKRLRLPRALMGIIGGFGLGIAGNVYQMVFKNPLASPDIVGVSSGASAGAAFAIVMISSAVPVVSLSAFAGAFITLIITLLIAYVVPGKSSYNIVLSGIAIHSLAQTFLMILKLVADPEKQLASIEYWIMGSLNAISIDSIWLPLIATIAGFIIMLLLYRQIMILSVNEDEAAALGVNVTIIRLLILTIATFVVSSIICTTGLISFIGLIAPHMARLLTGRNDTKTFIISGLTGSIILTVADIFARSAAGTELPVSVFTSLLGAPVLIILLVKKHRGQYI